MLSSGKGLLGVIYSTSEFASSGYSREIANRQVSILAYRRTIDWNQGVARMIELDHQVEPDWKWT